MGCCRVSLEVRQGDSGDVVDSVVDGTADVGFVGSSVGDARLESIPVADDEIVLAVHPSHRFARTGQVDVADLAGERLIFREHGSGTYRTVVAALAERNLALPLQDASMALGSTQAVCAAVGSALGIGFVSVRAARAHAADRLVYVTLNGVRSSGSCWLSIYA